MALLRAVRGHPAARKVPFILLTGRGDRELVVKAAQAGANNYLIKPFTRRHPAPEDRAGDGEACRDESVRKYGVRSRLQPPLTPKSATFLAAIAAALRETIDALREDHGAYHARPW